MPASGRGAPNRCSIAATAGGSGFGRRPPAGLGDFDWAGFPECGMPAKESEKLLDNGSGVCNNVPMSTETTNITRSDESLCGTAGTGIDSTEAYRMAYGDGAGMAALYETITCKECIARFRALNT